MTCPPCGRDCVSRWALYAHGAETHCNRRHALAGENLRIMPNGTRQCVTCRRAANQRGKEAWVARQRAVAA